MVKQPKKSETKVTRISASEKSESPQKVSLVDEIAKRAPRAVKPAITKKKVVSESTERRNLFIRMWQYLKGSWVELQQVRWPDRRSTWKMTGALLAFTLFFVVIILLLDYGFAELFKLILGN